MGKRILATEVVVCVIVLVLVVAGLSLQLAWLQQGSRVLIGRKGIYWRRGNLLSDCNRGSYSN